MHLRAYSGVRALFRELAETLDGTWLQVNRPLRDFDQHAVRTIRSARSY